MSWQHVDITAFGGPEVLQLVTETVLPEPGPGEVRVKVLTAGTGFTDTIIRQGQYVDVKQKPPFTLGYDWFGTVDKAGPGVSAFKVGDAVADMPVIGGYTQYLIARADRLVPCPPGLDPVQAVCMILSYTTAYQMLTRECALKPGDSILVHAAGGAVGSALLDLARLMGLTAYGTASAGKHALVRQFGAIPIDYRQDDFVQRIQQLTDGRGVNAVFDTIGGSHWARSYRCVAKGGTLVGFGALHYTTGEASVASVMWGFARLLALWKLLPDGRQTRFYNIHHRREKHPGEFKADVQQLLHWLQQGKLHPAVAECLPLAEAAEAHRRIDHAEVPGKIVLRCHTD